MLDRTAEEVETLERQDLPESVNSVRCHMVEDVVWLHESQDPGL